jgi:hypothetical protein
VAERTSSKKVAYSVSEIVFTLSAFHCLPENSRRGSIPGYKALAGFFSASFEGGRKSGGEGRPLLEYSVDLSQTRHNNDSCHEIQLESDRSTVHRL